MNYPDALVHHTVRSHRLAAARAAGPFAPARSLEGSLGRASRAASRSLGRVRGAARDAFPPAVALFWAAVVTLDFVNDWLIVGLTSSFRPLSPALVDVVVWWAPWILGAPLLSIPVRRLDPGRIGWSRSLGMHAGLMLSAITLHGLAAAWIFVVLRGGSVVGNFEHFARAFTLSEALLYGGIVTAYHVGWAGRPTSESEERGTVSSASERSWLRRFAVREGDVTRFVPVDDVSHVEAAGNYVRLHASDGEHLVRATLSGVEERLDPDRFRRIHRSTLVNVDRVERVDAWFNGDCVARLDDGRELRVSRTYRSALIDPLG